MTELINENQITGVILAGGQARRMGGVDKGLINLRGTPMIEYVIQRMQPQVKQLMINANRSIETYRKYGFPVVSDQLNNFQGPLAGMAASMQHTDTAAIAFAPCDAPLLPDNYIHRLSETMNQHGASIVCAFDGKRIQPVHALIKTALLDHLLLFLGNGGRKIDLWYRQHNFRQADFSDAPQAFTNANTIADLDNLKL